MWQLKYFLRQVVSFSVLVGAGWLLVQPDAGASLPDQLTQPLAPVLYDLRGEVSASRYIYIIQTISNLQVHLLPVLLFLAAVLATLLVSFLGCVGTCLRNRCMIAVVGSQQSAVCSQHSDNICSISCWC